MRICLLFSSYEGSSSVFADYDNYQNPGRYVPPDYKHTFTPVYLKKDTAIEQLDGLVAEGAHDLYWNLMWGNEHYGHDVAGMEAIRHLEAKGVEFIGTSSKFLAMSKTDVKRTLVKKAAGGVKTPKWTVVTEETNDVLGAGLCFPLIVKPANGCGSQHMTKDSVCNDEAGLATQLAVLRSKMKEDREIVGSTAPIDILVEEFIVGQELSVVVLETVHGLITLTPILIQFPLTWTPHSRFLHFENKFQRRDVVVERLLHDDENPQLVARISALAITAFNLLGIQGCGYARLDLRVSDADGQLYLLEVNQAPGFFCNLNDGFEEWDDVVIKQTFPGGHPGFIDTVVNAKLATMKKGKGVGGLKHNAN